MGAYDNEDIDQGKLWAMGCVGGEQNASYS